MPTAKVFRANHLLSALTVLLLSPMLAATGCAIGDDAPSEDSPRFTLEEVREIQNTQLQEFIDLVPADQVIEVWGPLPEMAAMSCDTDLGGNMPFWKERTGSYQLPGGADVWVQDAMDVPAWIDEIASRQELLGWEVLEENQYREKRVLYSPDGFVYTLTYFPRQDSREQSVGINSFGPCFIPSSDFNPHLHY